jgi:hypothetical protein
MGMTAQGSGSGLYEISTGRFKGLFNSEPASAIPDDYLADMANLQVNVMGALKSVLKPIIEPTASASAGIPITSIHFSQTMRFSGGVMLMYGQGDSLYVQTGLKINPSGGCAGMVPIVDYFLGSYLLVQGESKGLYDALGSGYIAAATTGFSIVTWGAIAVYEMRLWLGLNNTLRGSAPGMDPAAETAVNGGRKVWGPWEGLNKDISMMFPHDPQINFLIATHGGLLIFCDSNVYSMATFYGGKAVPIYHGDDLPRGIRYSVLTFPYCDGETVYYANERGLFSFNGRPSNLSSLIAPTAIVSTGIASYVGEYDDRIWFLVAGQGVPTATNVNYIYALNKLTNCWEKYDVQMTTPAEGYDTPSALASYCTGVGSRLAIGTTQGTIYQWYYNQATTAGVLPWHFTTKAFSPSFDQPHAPIKFRVDYITQTTAAAATSPVVVTTYLDGVAIATTITFDMAEGTGGALRHREFDIPSNLTANSVQFMLEGTGKAEIEGVGYSLSIYPVGDTNP